MSKLLWTPSEDRIKNSNMWRFINFINDRHNLSISSYEPLYLWSIENIADFWLAIWEFVEVKYSQQYDQIVDNLNNMPGAEWFSGARLNFTEIPDSSMACRKLIIRWINTYFVNFSP